MMVTVGAYFGGPELQKSAIQSLICSAMEAVDQVFGEWNEGSAPAVNVVFYVPGSLDAYGGLKQIEAARFSRKQRLLLVAVPVPKEVAAVGGSVEFVTDALRKATTIAAEVFARKGIGPFDLVKAQVGVESVRHALLAQQVIDHGNQGTSHRDRQ